MIEYGISMDDRRKGFAFSWDALSCSVPRFSRPSMSSSWATKTPFVFLLVVPQEGGALS